MILQILANGLWQGAAIVAIAIVAARIFSRESASTRYAIWLAALVALAIVPVLSALWPLHFPSFDREFHQGHGTMRMTLIAATTAVERAATLATLAFAVWYAGIALGFARLALSAVRISRIRRSAAPLRDYNDVVVSDMVATPIAAGFRSPVVIVPAAILEQLPPNDLSLIVAHERAHIARHDIIANFVQRAIEAVLFFNPWAYVIGHYLVKEREAACDDAAVVKTGLIDDYAAALAAVARAVSRPRAPLVSPSVLGSRRALVRRIERLVNGGALRRSELNWSALSVTIVTFVALALVLQSVAPVFAAQTGAANQRMNSVVAAACAHPNTDVSVTGAAPPNIPDTAHPKRAVLLRVTVAADGSVPRVIIVQSSGDVRVDNATVDAATRSRYAPATQNCRAVQGTYLFRAAFAPSP